MKIYDNVNFKKTHLKSTSNSFVNSSIIKNKENKNNSLTFDRKEKIKVNEEIKKKDNNIILTEEEIENNKKKLNKSFINKEITIHDTTNNEIKEDIFEKCMNQYDDELYNLKNLEEILLNQKKIINQKKKIDKKKY